MLDHIGIPVSDYTKAKAFYEKALAPLGIGTVMEVGPEQTGDDWACGFGAQGNPFFWIGSDAKVARTHVAFVAKDRAQVDAFRKAALAAGARDNGAPGLRPHYHEHSRCLRARSGRARHRSGLPRAASLRTGHGLI